jgi:oxygen-independent coproporphyrinogen-3 oxidase
LVGPSQRWRFEPPPPEWTPPRLVRTSLYLHVPFCRHFCPYCPYTKTPYRQRLLAPYTAAALAEIDWWAEQVGPAEISTAYIGGGTPTLAMDSVASILEHARKRFHLRGDICIETNPADVDAGLVAQMHEAGIALVSLGVQSFQADKLAAIGRGYQPETAARSLDLLTSAGFASVNADLMFALPGQSLADVLFDLARAAQLGANQITTYPLFTFPYTPVGNHLRLKGVRMPRLNVRRRQYKAISQWCEDHDFQRVSVWGFKRGSVPRYSSVTRAGYIGIGPGSGSQLPDGFVLNTFDLEAWMQTAGAGRSAIALRMPFSAQMSGWWWLYWRFYETRIPLDAIDAELGTDAAKARLLLWAAQKAGMATTAGRFLELTPAGAFWLHLAQNYFALNYVNTLWTQARRQPWPQSIAL